MKLKRHKQNPILKPTKNDWESEAVFNCGAVCKDNLVHLLYRAIGDHKKYKSTLGYAVSRDGINFKRYDKPVFESKEEYEKWGCEDPRITQIGNKFYITYVALSKPAHKGGGPPKTALATTTDFINFERQGIITPEGAEDKDVVLFPEKINGKYVMLHRPSNWIRPDYSPENPSIWITYSDDLKNWNDHKVVIEPEREWEGGKIGVGPPPIKTDKGWLLIYHGSSWLPNSKFKNYRGKLYDRIYKAGAVLLDIEDPSKIIGKTKGPILDPEEDYEIFGDVPNVVFPEGTVVRGDELFVYYGAADKTCCLATCKLEELIESLVKEL